MAAGSPTVLADTPIFHEVAGDAADYFTEGSARSLVAVMTRLLSERSERELLVGRGRRRAARFTWDEHARRAAAAYRDLLAEAVR